MIGKPMLLVGWLAVGVAVFQTAPLTRLVFNPQAAEIVDGEVIMYRSYPMDLVGLPRPWMSYVETVRPITKGHNGGHVCVDRGGPFQYVLGDEFASWRIDWAEACTNDPFGYYWSAKWTWHIGRIKLGPAKYSITVLKPKKLSETPP